MLYCLTSKFFVLRDGVMLWGVVCVWCVSVASMFYEVLSRFILCDTPPPRGRAPGPQHICVCVCVHVCTF